MSEKMEGAVLVVRVVRNTDEDVVIAGGTAWNPSNITLVEWFKFKQQFSDWTLFCSSVCYPWRIFSAKNGQASAHDTHEKIMHTAAGYVILAKIFSPSSEESRASDERRFCRGIGGRTFPPTNFSNLKNPRSLSSSFLTF